MDMNSVVFCLDSSHFRITQVQKICLKILSQFFEYIQITHCLCLFVCKIWEWRENAVG